MDYKPFRLQGVWGFGFRAVVGWALDLLQGFGHVQSKVLVAPSEGLDQHDEQC